MNERATGRGVKLRAENGGVWDIKQVLYADGTVLVAETMEHLQYVVNKLERVCDKMMFKINFGKSKVLVVIKDQVGSCEKVGVSGEEMQEVDKFNYL